ncbi:MAG: hypothetical protein A2527_08845 [Candidatus Lambdaproteobacteria bacterium RIFOXYD2_FULL_50_16]|uniref:Uncharacterized protein n=1 Tax=Candidatus Lambdaproteobacteria bacterium RIFOXYD2_FULL_50_16 TaxID=1817772 RepID=A0A1F6GAY0_9PROT|nr:MAG: hypothetical protein A2527_08845 [Candidatus Lambdaproteobacteria bacterium RIFOXYD2_FULL_50_16]
MKKKLVITAGLLLGLYTNLLAVELAEFEKCNNVHRRYCQPGAHEDKTNEELLNTKKKGYKVTIPMIRYVAQKYSPNFNPAPIPATPP